MKWYLDDDPVSVEDKLASYVRRHNRYETFAHSLVLNLQDREICSLFTPTQLDRIKALCPKLPDADEGLKRYFGLFENVGLASLLRFPFP